MWIYTLEPWWLRNAFTKTEESYRFNTDEYLFSIFYDINLSQRNITMNDNR